MHESITYNSSSFLASCLGFGSAQKAWENYKESKYTACCKEIAYTIGTLSCVVSLGVLAYVCLSSEPENTHSQETSNPFEKTTIWDLGETLSTLSSIYFAIRETGFSISNLVAPVLRPPNPDYLSPMEPIPTVGKISFNPEVKNRAFYYEWKEDGTIWSNKHMRLMPGFEMVPVERVGIRYIPSERSYIRLKG